MLLKNLFNHLKDNDSILSYFSEVGIVEKINCPKCRRIMAIDIDRRRYRCGKKTCKKEVRMFFNTFLENAHIRIGDLLLLTYLYINKTPVSSIISMLGLSSHTVTNWTSYVRQLCADNVEMCRVQIGGEGIIVEIDETKMGKRKYNRGHRVEGVWVVAGIERTNEKKVFAVKVPDRTAATLKDVIATYVKPGSIIYTDCWTAYNSACGELGLEHSTVNHSENFVDPITGTHTNTIEGLNNGLKTIIKARNRVKSNINEYLWFYIWLRQHKNDFWGGIILAVKTQRYNCE